MSFEHKVKELKKVIDDGYMSLGEFESQYQSEVAQFGDAGPGQYNTIQEIKVELKRLEDKLASLMATPIGKALQAKWDNEYKIEEEKYKLDDPDHWPF